MHKTPFAGLTELDANDPLLVDGGSFVRENPSRIDRLLQVGAVSHHHDAHAAMSDPLMAPSAWTQPSGGAIPANTNIYVGYTVEDGFGGETRLAPAVATNTDTPLNPPSGSITASGDYSAGSLMIGNYYYGITFLDGGGGETPIGTPVAFARDPGWASAQVHISGMGAELDPPDGPVAWRLWRSTNGGPFQLLASGSGDSFIDNGVNCTDCTVQPPAPTPGSNTTRSESLLNVVLPLPGDEPVIASGAANGGEIRLYISTDGAFSNPSFYERYPLSSAGQLIQVPLLATDQGAPPDVSTCMPGATKIDPDVDLLDFHWKRPVDTFGHFPASGEFGDVRMAIDTRLPYIWVASANYWEHWDGAAGPAGAAGSTGPAGASGANGANGAPGASGAPGPTGATGAAGPPGSVAIAGSGGVDRLLNRVEIDFAGSGGTGVAVQDKGGGSAQVLISGPAGGGGGVTLLHNGNNAEETVTNDAFTAMPSPDSATFVLAEDSFVRVYASGGIRQPGAGGTRVALFIDGVQATNENGDAMQVSTTSTAERGFFLQPPGYDGISAQRASQFGVMPGAFGAGARRGNGGEFDLILPAGSHTIELRYQPTSSGATSYASHRSLVVAIDGPVT